MGIDFCNDTKRQSLSNLFDTKRDMDIKPLYTYLCPVIIFICFFSIIFNAILMSISRQSKVINKSPILLLSLNLAVTDLIASLLNGLGILFNSYLPEVYDIKMGQCSMLMFEVFRCGALVASALHLLALAFIHYRGIVNPLHYRSTIFFSQHLSRTINIISIACWIIPLTIMIAWFSSSPCQGFQSPECDYLFLLSFTYRYTVLTLFALPLLLMSLIYLRIFIIISRHQKGRRLTHERSTLTRGVLSAVGPTGTVAAVNLPDLIAKTDAAACVRCTACAARALQDDDDPTIPILSDEMIDKEPLTKSMICTNEMNVKSADKEDMKEFHGVSSADPFNEKNPKSGIPSWLQNNFSSGSSIQNYANKSKLSRTCETQDKNNVDNSYSSVSTIYELCRQKTGEQNSMNELDNQTCGSTILVNQNSVMMQTFNSIQINNSTQTKTLYNQCDSNNGKNNYVEFSQEFREESDHNSTLVDKESVPNQAPERDFTIITKPIIVTKVSESRLGFNVKPADQQTANSVSNQEPELTGSHLKDSYELHEDVNKTNDTIEFGSRFGAADRLAKKTVSMAASKDHLNDILSEGDKKLIDRGRTSSYKNNEIKSKVAPKSQYSLDSHDGHSDGMEVRLLTIPNSQGNSRYTKRLLFHRPGQLSLDQQHSKLVPNNKSLNWECTCYNKLEGKFNAKLLRSNTIGENTPRITTTLTGCTTNKAMITVSGIQRSSSISSAVAPESSSQKYNLSWSPTDLASRSQSCVQQEYRSTITNKSSLSKTISATASTYEPQRRHLHASAVPQTNTKALVTTLLILGTYFISYIPAISFQVLTCIDNCPYPLYTISFSRRVLFGAMTNLLLIAKSIIDPFIYSYRMSEIQVAISRYLSKRRSKSSMAASMHTSQRLNTVNLNTNNNLKPVYNQHNINLNATQANSSFKILKNSDKTAFRTTSTSSSSNQRKQQNTIERDKKYSNNDVKLMASKSRSDTQKHEISELIKKKDGEAKSEKNTIINNNGRIQFSLENDPNITSTFVEKQYVREKTSSIGSIKSNGIQIVAKDLFKL